MAAEVKSPLFIYHLLKHLKATYQRAEIITLIADKIEVAKLSAG
ncbi:conserved hypothetical protein [Escherichia coli M605]|uniref:Uncharacterized protein n=1 Tax=Escherichia coli M605 TaxID=656417 RepID=F4SY75_ECOLX|nr:conserved hypothetical protein [Escherichia coli M605]